MNVLQAFGETGYTIVAVILPLVLLGLFLLCGWEARDIDRETRQVARGAKSDMAAIAVHVVGGTQGGLLRLFQVILFLCLVINILLATVPYARSHGW